MYSRPDPYSGPDPYAKPEPADGPDPGEPLLVIDVGHTASAAALLEGDRCRLLSEPVGGARRWPSVACFDGRQLLVGTLADQQRLRHPATFTADLKQGLTGDAEPSGAGRHRAVQRVTALLIAMRAEAERLRGGPVRQALVTVPAGQGPGDPLPAGLVAAGGAAGFATVHVVAQHLAAAHAPAAGPGIAPGDLVLVYDLGGGSFNATLVQVGTPAPVVLGHAGLDDCGGRDIDLLLARRIRQVGHVWLAPMIATAGDHDTVLRLSMAVTESARRIKHRLSDVPVVWDQLLPGTPEHRLNQVELATIAGPVLHRTVRCCRELLAGLDVAPSQLATILLVGGGSRMPAVVDLLARELGRPLRRADDPELAGVQGAVRWRARGVPRLVPALGAGAGRPLPLAFILPGGRGRLLRWLIAPGESYLAGQALARVRLPGGGLWDLTAGAAGTLQRQLAVPGTDIATHQWLALTG